MSTRARLRFSVPLLIGAFLVGIVGIRSVTANSTAQPLPFGQDWSNTGLITLANNWTNVPGIVGYQGIGLTRNEGIDPQTVLVDGDAPSVLANQTDPAGLFQGGVAEFEDGDPTIAIKGSATAAAPNIVLTLNTVGKSNVFVTYNLRDIDSSSANAIESVAAQYRVGTSGTFTNLPAGFVADATTGPNEATLVTPVEVGLPAAANDQNAVQVRIITTNATGADEWVGVDDIAAVAAEDSPPDVASTSPANGDTNVMIGSNLSVTFTEPVNLASGWFNLTCATSGSHSATVSGGPTTYTINPSTPFVHDESCTLRIRAWSVTDVDTIDPPNRMPLDKTISFRTIPPDDAPTVKAFAPADGTTNVPIADSLGVAFSEPVDVAAGAFTLDCTGSGAHSLAVSGGPTSFTLDPTTDLGYGETCTVTVHAAKVSDQDLNDPPDHPVADQSASFTTVPPPDQAPTVTATTPTDGATGVPVGASLDVTFSEPVDVAAGGFTLHCASSGDHTVVTSGGPTTFTLTPDVEFANSESCTLTVHAAQVTDQDTNDPPDNMVSDATASFTTADPAPVDNAPTVVSTSPADTTTDVPVDANVSVTFSEPVNVVPGWAGINCATSGAHPGLPSGGPTTWTVDPNTDFASGETCTVTITGADVTDQDLIDPPDAMTANTTFTFTTHVVPANTPPPNLPPTVNAGGPYQVEQGGTVQVSASGTDPENGAITYAWDLDNNGTFETVGQTVTFSAAGLTAPLTKTIAVRGTDPGGMYDTKTATVNVVWHNGGFQLPGGGNRVTFKAGANVPVKFSLGGNQGLDILRAGYPASDAMTCGGTAPTDASGPIDWGGKLKYDPVSDSYSFNWKTDKAWANSCRVLVLGLKDGTNLTATFEFK
jgi:Big-like domain-containing protein